MSLALDKGQPPGWCMCRAWQRKNFHGRRTLLSSAALIIIKIRMATIMTMYRNDRTNNMMMMMMMMTDDDDDDDDDDHSHYSRII